MREAAALMRRLIFHGKLIVSGMTAASILLAVVLLVTACNLQRWQFVEELQVRQVMELYEIAFPLAAVFLMAGLLAEELDEGVLRWLPSLPYGRSLWLLERWMVGLAGMASIYFGSLWVVDTFVISLPWPYFITGIIVPSIWLGQLGFTAALLFRSPVAGLGAALAHWSVEVLSRGWLTGDGYLFLASVSYPVTGTDGNPLDENRLLYAGLTVMLAVLSPLAMRWSQRRY